LTLIRKRSWAQASLQSWYRCGKEDYEKAIPEGGGRRCRKMGAQPRRAEKKSGVPDATGTPFEF